MVLTSTAAASAYREPPFFTKATNLERVQNRAFCAAQRATEFTRASCFFFEQRGSLLYNGLAKNQERIALPSTTSDRQNVRSQRAKMYVNQRREDWRENESTHYVTIISARNTDT